MAKPESKVEKHLVKGVKARGGWATKVRDLGRKGIPDRECRFSEARIVFIELKARGGRLSKAQIEYHKDLRALGFTVLVLWTIELVDDWFWFIDQGIWPENMHGTETVRRPKRRVGRVARKKR